MQEKTVEPVGKKQKKGTFRKALLFVVIFLVLIIGAVFAFVWHKLDLIRYENELPSTAELTSEPEAGDDFAADEEIVDISGLEAVTELPEIPDAEIFGESDVLNILVIGTDERADHFDDNARSDCMILVSIHKGDKTVKLVSLERGMGVPILEGGYAGQYDWLTHVFRYGGAELLRKTVEYCFKVEVPYYVRLIFDSVEGIVDTVGGVDIELTALEAAGLNGQVYTNAETRAEVHEGLNHLDGYDALQYCRLRYIDSDWKRVERQRKVIFAVVEAARGFGLAEYNDLADTVLPMVRTNMKKLEIAELILYVPSFLRSEFDQMTLPKAGTYGSMTVMGGRHAFAPDFEINSDLLRRFLYEGADAKDLLAE